MDKIGNQKKMARCRTCGKHIYCLLAEKLFQQPDNKLLQQIEALTGLLLPEQIEFPSHICGPCEISLREAHAFRERIIRTQNLLLHSRSVADALQKIDLDEVEQRNIVEDSDDLELELTSSYEQITAYEHGGNESLKQSNESINKTSVEKHIAAVPGQNHVPNELISLPKPVAKLYPSVSFATKRKKRPRINWSQLSADDIAAIQREKREERKRNCICEQCGKHFTCPSNFKLHLLRHTGIKNFACTQCPMKFYTSNLLRSHEFVHLCKKPYPCGYCSKTFADHSGRQIHERSNHTNIRPFKCPQCDKSFVVNSMLKTHMLSHTGVRKFHCLVCNASFLRKCHLVAHNSSKTHQQNAQNKMEGKVLVDVA